MNLLDLLRDRLRRDVFTRWRARSIRSERLNDALCASFPNSARVPVAFLTDAIVFIVASSALRKKVTSLFAASSPSADLRRVRISSMSAANFTEFFFERSIPATMSVMPCTKPCGPDFIKLKTVLVSTPITARSVRNPGSSLDKPVNMSWKLDCASKIAFAIVMELSRASSEFCENLNSPAANAAVWIVNSAASFPASAYPGGNKRTCCSIIFITSGSCSIAPDTSPVFRPISSRLLATC